MQHTATLPASLLAAAALASACGAPPATTPATAPPVAVATPTTAAPADVPPAPATPATRSTAAPAPPACSGAPVEGAVPGATGTARVTDVAVASHEDAGYDRFVIRLSGAPTSYRVLPQGTPDFFEDASGRPVTLEGGAGVKITLQGVAGTPAYAGPTDLHPRLAQLREARQTGSFEGVVSWGLGLAGNGCLRVMAPTVASPTLVVDIVTR